MPIANHSEDFDVAIQGVPFDGSVSYRPGARFGPSQVREVSSLGRVFHLEKNVSWVDKLRVADVGDVSVNPLQREATLAAIEKSTLELLKSGKKVISVGGDHLTTLGHLRAYKQFYGKPIGFIHFDAHLDTYPAAWGEDLHHGAFARLAIEEKLVDPKRMMQLGIRGPLAGADDLDFVHKHGIKVYTIDEIKTQGAHNIPLLNIDGPCYLSFDVDALDPAYAPGTGTPVIGGLTSYEAQVLLRRLRGVDLVGGDVVEVSPPYDHSQITSLFAVDVIFELLTSMASKIP